ncbi:hypothetical protein Desaci_2287 [Desulfosporosinus acidiphilus SJ4]|uniref:Uncharacterized protein n=1 Tax=Desulfosporosinus acidiphilus (strain DSM 22704 / JCM 16185 / SJ4) TaxID=646529 RepID=I4D618_DESAJ|nr:hypothetical protein Desaci_2287 [Desulfosporosinus acidiphilus SJ4]
MMIDSKYNFVLLGFGTTGLMRLLHATSWFW